MRPLPYTHTGAGSAFYAVFVTFVLLELRIRVRSRLNRSGSPEDRDSLVAVWLFVTGGLVAAFVLARSGRGAAIGSARWPLFVTGDV